MFAKTRPLTVHVAFSQKNLDRSVMVSPGIFTKSKKAGGSYDVITSFHQYIKDNDIRVKKTEGHYKVGDLEDSL